MILTLSFPVSDYVCGGELFKHLETQKEIPENDARFYMAEITHAIGWLHSVSTQLHSLCTVRAALEIIHVFCLQTYLCPFF